MLSARVSSTRAVVSSSPPLDAPRRSDNPLARPIHVVLAPLLTPPCPPTGFTGYRQRRRFFSLCPKRFLRRPREDARRHPPCAARYPARSTDVRWQTPPNMTAGPTRPWLHLTAATSTPSPQVRSAPPILRVLTTVIYGFEFVPPPLAILLRFSSTSCVYSVANETTEQGAGESRELFFRGNKGACPHLSETVAKNQSKPGAL